MSHGRNRLAGLAAASLMALGSRGGSSRGSVSVFKAFTSVGGQGARGPSRPRARDAGAAGSGRRGPAEARGPRPERGAPGAAPVYVTCMSRMPLHCGWGCFVSRASTALQNAPSHSRRRRAGWRYSTLCGCSERSRRLREAASGGQGRRRRRYECEWKVYGDASRVEGVGGSDLGPTCMTRLCMYY